MNNGCSTKNYELWISQALNFFYKKECSQCYISNFDNFRVFRGFRGFRLFVGHYKFYYMVYENLESSENSENSESEKLPIFKAYVSLSILQYIYLYVERCSLLFFLTVRKKLKSFKQIKCVIMPAGRWRNIATIKPCWF